MKKIVFCVALLLTLCFLFSCESKELPQTDESETKENVSETSAETVSDSGSNREDETENENKNGILTVNPDDYYKCVVFDLPEGNFRDVAVDYMRKQASIEWVCENDFSVTDKFENWSIGLDYKKGVTYHGITYTNVKSSYDEFMMFYKDGKVSMESGGSNDVVGNGCFSATQNATQQFDSTCAGVTDVIMPSYKGFEAKIVGDYKVTEGVKKTADIISSNSPDVIYNAYSQLKKGDLILQKDDTKGMSHVRMLVEDPTIVYKNGTKTIVPSRCSVKTIEQTNAFDKTRTDGVNTTWYVDHVYTFNTLYETAYLPITLESYEKDRSEMEIPYLILDEEITPAVLAKKTFSGSVKSNFPLRFVKAELLDKDGNVVSVKMKNNMADSRVISLRNHFASLFDGIENGEYTLVLTAGISRGSAELARVEFVCNK